MSEPARPLLVGQEHPVPLVTGEWRPYVNLDYAASTPCLVEVARAVEALLPWYSSVHRGAGFKSQVSTAAYEGARAAVRDFLQARRDDVVIFTRNTTDSTNLLAACLPAETEVLAFAVEHHANLLPWRRTRGRVTYLPIPSSPDEALSLLAEALRRGGADPRLVAVTGASNVTGEVWPIRAIANLAHRHGARVLLDAAQLAPHYPIDLQGSGVDYVAFSGHKIYAPFGAGVLVGRPDWLRVAPPFLYGGGAVELVTLDDVLWAPPPDRQEAGSPNVLGAVALGVACRALCRYGMEHMAEEEIALAATLRRRLASIPGLTTHALWQEGAAPRLGMLAFNLDGYHHAHVAAILSAEHGVGVRHGCFCAHPLMIRLLEYDADGVARVRAEIERGRRHQVPGAVRISIGLGTTPADIEYVAQALETIVAEGPRWRYRTDEASGDCVPDPETRAWPTVPFPLHDWAGEGGEAS